MTGSLGSRLRHCGLEGRIEHQCTCSLGGGELLDELAVLDVGADRGCVTRQVNDTDPGQAGAGDIAGWVTWNGRPAIVAGSLAPGLDLKAL
jgi:hypothetical protein